MIAPMLALARGVKPSVDYLATQVAFSNNVTAQPYVDRGSQPLS
jgi:hypothetical protein